MVNDGDITVEESVIDVIEDTIITESETKFRYYPIVHKYFPNMPEKAKEELSLSLENINTKQRYNNAATQINSLIKKVLVTIFYGKSSNKLLGIKTSYTTSKEFWNLMYNQLMLRTYGDISKVTFKDFSDCFFQINNNNDGFSIIVDMQLGE